MNKCSILCAIVLAVASMNCAGYVVTTGSLEETVTFGAADQSFNLSGPDFSFVGTALNRQPPCSFRQCLEGTTMAIIDGVGPEAGSVSAVMTASGVSYSFMEGPGTNLGCCMEVDYSLSIPSTAPDIITLTAPFTMTGAVGGITCFPPTPSCTVPLTLFDGTGTATVQLRKISSNQFALQSAVYNFGPAVPEPGTFALSIITIAILYFLKRRHRAPV